MADLTARIVIGAALSGRFRNTFRTADRHAQRLWSRLHRIGVPPALESDTRSVGRALDRLGRSQREVGRGADRMSDGARRASRRFRELRTEAGRAGDAVRRVGRGGVGGAGLAGIGAGVGAAYATARQIRRAFDLEEARVHARGVIVPPAGEGADAALERAVARASRFAGPTLATEAELLSGFYEASSAGLVSPLASAVAEVGHTVARVTRGEIGGVVPVLSRSLNLFGSQIRGRTDEERAVLLGDVLTTLQQSEQISNFGALGESIKAGGAGILGARAQAVQSLALLAKLQSQGLEGSQAGTALSALLRALPRAAQKLDFDIARDQDGLLDVTETLRRLHARVRDLNQDARSIKLLESMESQAVEAANLLFDVLDDVDQLTEKAQRGGVTMEGYGRLVESAGGKAKVAGQNIQQLGDRTATSLLPAIGKALGPLGDVGTRLGDVIEKSPLAQDAIIGVAGALGILGGAAAAVKIGGALGAILGSPAIAAVLAVTAGSLGGRALSRRFIQPRVERDYRRFEELARPRDPREFAGPAPTIGGPGLARLAGVFGGRSPGSAFELTPAPVPRSPRTTVFEEGSIIVNGAGLPVETAFEVLRRVDEEDRIRSEDRSHYDLPN